VKFLHLTDLICIYFGLAGALVINDTLWPKLDTSTLNKLNLTQVEGEASTISKANFSTADEIIQTSLGLLETEDGNGLWSPVTLLFNTTSDHSFPALIQELAQVAFRTRTNNTSATLRMSSHPLPLTKNEALRCQSVLTGLAALFTLIPLSYCAASFAVFVIQERVVKAKLLQVSDLADNIKVNLMIKSMAIYNHRVASQLE